MNFKKIAFASLLFTLMILAIFAGIMSMSGTLSSMQGGGTASQEKMLILPVQFIGGSGGVNDNINSTLANVGSASATITGCILKDRTGNVVRFIELASQTEIEKGTFKRITLTLNPDTIVDGTIYTLTVVTAAGGSFVSAPFDRSTTAEYDPLKDLVLQSMLQKSALSTPPTKGNIIQYGPVYAPIPTPVIILSAIVAAFSVLSAYVLSQRIVGSKNRKDRSVVFFFISVIFVSIIVWFVSTLFLSGTLAA